MKYLIKSALILDKKSPYYKKRIDFIVSNGKIIEISSKITPPKNFQIVKGKNLILSPALIDLNAQSGEPNNTEAETLSTLLEAGRAGGFAYICHQPTSNASIENKSAVSFLHSMNSQGPSQVIAIGSLTKKEDNTKLSEIREMREAGALAFSSGNDYTIKADLLSNALQYIKGFQGKVMVHPEKKELSKNGQVNQGIMSLTLGYKGIPQEAELIAVNEIVQLAEYNDAEVLILNLSLPASIDRINKSNKSKKRIYTSTSSMHLILHEKCLLDYDSNYKLAPPVRKESDVKKLQKAIVDGNIDIVYSQHTPCTEEEKNLEFDLANHGAINIQTAFLSCLQALGKENIEKCIEVMSTNPSQYLRIDLPAFNLGSEGAYTLLDLDDQTVFSREMNKSKSKNSPFFETSFVGKIKGIIANKTEFFN
jgi:dihydroorotase